MSSITVHKVQQAEAIQINSPEDEETVRGWLLAMGVQGQAGLDALKQKGFWFLRDHGSEVVYVVSDEDFEKNFEQVADEDVTGAPVMPDITVQKHRPDFTF